MNLEELWKFGLGLHKVIKRHHFEEDEVALTATSIHEHNTRIRNLRFEGLTNTQIALANDYQVLLYTYYKDLI